MPITLTVANMSCEGCEDIITNAVTEVAGVESATADRHEGTVVVEGEVKASALVEAIDFAGYKAEVGTPDEEEEDESPEAPETDEGSDEAAESSEASDESVEGADDAEDSESSAEE